MGTDRITPSSSLLETLRALARERTRDAQRGTATDKSAHQDRPIPVTPKHDVQTLRHRLRDLAADTDLSDMQSMLQARSQTLREILLWEFGSDFRTDSQFLPMVDAIGKTIDADPALQQRFMDLMTELRKA